MEGTVVPLLRDHPQGQTKGGPSKEVVSDEGNLVWDTIAFVPSKAGLTKEVVFHEVILSKDVKWWQIKEDSLYTNICISIVTIIAIHDIS